MKQTLGDILNNIMLEVKNLENLLFLLAIWVFILTIFIIVRELYRKEKKK